MKDMGQRRRSKVRGGSEKVGARKIP